PDRHYTSRPLQITPCPLALEPSWNPASPPDKRRARTGTFQAEREGFEPSAGVLPLHTLSRRAPSTTRSPLQTRATRIPRPRAPRSPSRAARPTSCAGSASPRRAPWGAIRRSTGGTSLPWSRPSRRTSSSWDRRSWSPGCAPPLPGPPSGSRASSTGARAPISSAASSSTSPASASVSGSQTAQQTPLTAHARLRESPPTARPTPVQGDPGRRRGSDATAHRARDIRARLPEPGAAGVRRRRDLRRRPRRHAGREPAARVGARAGRTRLRAPPLQAAGVRVPDPPLARATEPAGGAGPRLQRGGLRGLLARAVGRGARDASVRVLVLDVVDAPALDRGRGRGRLIGVVGAEELDRLRPLQLGGRQEIGPARRGNPDRVGRTHVAAGE